MNAGGRADSSPGRAVTLSVFLFAASTATLGHGAPKPPNAPESTAPIASTRPQDDSLDAPRPPFVVTTEVTVASSVEFGASGGTTMHHLAIDAPPFDTGTLELTADGAFGTTIDRALASAEGVIDTEAAAAGAD